MKKKILRDKGVVGGNILLPEEVVNMCSIVS